MKIEVSKNDAAFLVMTIVEVHGTAGIVFSGEARKLFFDKIL